MQFLSENPESSFSPSGVLKAVVKEENLIEAARRVLDQLRIENKRLKICIFSIPTLD
jgi:hypothetical protein